MVKIFLDIRLKITFLLVWVCLHVCMYGINVEVEGSLRGSVYSFHLYLGSEIKVSSLDLCSKHLYPPSCVTGTFTCQAVTWAPLPAELCHAWALLPIKLCHVYPYPLSCVTGTLSIFLPFFLFLV